MAFDHRNGVPSTGRRTTTGGFADPVGITYGAVPASYSITEWVDGTQTVRAAGTGATAWLVLCCCGFKGGPFATPELAELVRGEHEDSCLWPKR